MLSLVMLRDMNRSEQESLYRTSRKLSLVPLSRNPSHGNIFDVRRGSCARVSCPEEGSRGASPQHQEDLVLSVLKSPVNHVSVELKDSNCGTSLADEDDGAESGDHEEDGR